MPCKVAASGEAFVASRTVEGLWRRVCTCPSSTRGDPVGHLSTWVPSVIRTLHQRHPRVRMRWGITHVLVHAHMAQRRWMSGIRHDRVITRARNTGLRLHSWGRWRPERGMYKLLLELCFCGNDGSRTFSVQNSRDVHGPTQRSPRIRKKKGRAFSLASSLFFLRVDGYLHRFSAVKKGSDACWAENGLCQSVVVLLLFCHVGREKKKKSAKVMSNGKTVGLVLYVFQMDPNRKRKENRKQAPRSIPPWPAAEAPTTVELKGCPMHKRWSLGW